MIPNRIFLGRGSITIFDVDDHDMETILKLACSIGHEIGVIEAGVSRCVVEIAGTEKQLYNFMRAAFDDLKGIVR